MHTYSTYSDDSLLELWCSGDELAFNLFYERYFTKLVSEAWHRLHHWETAEEIVQDVFLRLYTKGAAINNSPLAYCRKFLKDKIVDHYRRKLEIVPEAWNSGSEAILADKPATLRPVEVKELERTILEQVMRLPEQCRQVFSLRREGNLSNQDVARKLGISIKTVEAHMSKALRMLRESLGWWLWVVVIPLQNL